MKYANFEKAKALSEQIELIKQKIKGLQSVLASSEHYYIRVVSKNPILLDLDMSVEGKDSFLERVASHYLSELEKELINKIREFEAL